MHAQSREIWGIGEFARKIAASPTDDRLSSLEVKPVTANNTSPLTRHVGNVTYAAREMYLLYYYPSASDCSAALKAHDMNTKWPYRGQVCSKEDYQSSFHEFVIEECACTSTTMWLLAAVTLALETHLASTDDAFTILSETFDVAWRGLKNPKDFSKGSLAARLKADMRYWSAFAKSRGLMAAMSEERFALGPFSDQCRIDLHRLILVLLVWSSEHGPGGPGGPGYMKWRLANLTYPKLKGCALISRHGAATVIAASLQRIGLPLRLHRKESETVVHFGP